MLIKVKKKRILVISVLIFFFVISLNANVNADCVCNPECSPGLINWGGSCGDCGSIMRSDCLSNCTMSGWYCENRAPTNYGQACGNCGTIDCAGNCINQGPCSPGQTSCSDDTTLVCSSGCQWQTGQNCNNQDGWYCNGATRDYRDYSCSAGSCSYNVISSENCAIRSSTDTDGSCTAYTVGGTVTDYTTCTLGDCSSDLYSDSCSGTTLTEYCASGSSSISSQYECQNFESDYCSGDKYYRNEWACSGSPGTCTDAADTLIGTNADGDAKDKECGDSLCDNAVGIYDSTKTSNEVGLCSDGLDNDCDGLKDCADGDCAGLDCCVSNYGQSCGSCGGTIQCDGSCSISTPSNYNQLCGACGRGHINCAGACVGDYSNCGSAGWYNTGSSCANCGTEQRYCNGCDWTSSYQCINQGVCSPDSTQTQTCICPEGNQGTQSRICTSSCSWGSWGECTGCGLCFPPGRTRTVDCGNCGTNTSTCQWNFQWGTWSECTGEGECTPGQTQPQNCGNCGTQSRTCASSCSWGTWGACTGEGECTPEETQSQSCGVGGTQSRTCTSSCSWGSWGECIEGKICESDCTWTDDDIVHASCDGRNGCTFCTPTIKSFCDGKRADFIYDYPTGCTTDCQSERCPGCPQPKLESAVKCEEGKTLVKVTRIVYYQGKPVRLIVATCA